MNNRHLIPLLIAALILAAAVFLALDGAVDRYYDYQEMVAPRSLHQMTDEFATEGDAEHRSRTMLYGAGLFAMAVLVFGGFIFAMRGGEEFVRQTRLLRRRGNHRSPAPMDRPVPTATSAPRAPMLGDGGAQEGHYE